MKFKHPRFRHTFLYIGAFLIVVLFVLTDPNNGIIESLPFGASTLVLISQLLKSVWFIGMLHAGRRALFDYLDLRLIFLEAEKSSEGAGQALMAVAIAMVAIAIVIAAAVLSN